MIGLHSKVQYNLQYKPNQIERDKHSSFILSSHNSDIGFDGTPVTIQLLQLETPLKVAVSHFVDEHIRKESKTMTYRAPTCFQYVIVNPAVNFNFHHGWELEIKEEAAVPVTPVDDTVFLTFCKEVHHIHTQTEIQTQHQRNTESSRDISLSHLFTPYASRQWRLQKHRDS